MLGGLKIRITKAEHAVQSYAAGTGVRGLEGRGARRVRGIGGQGSRGPGSQGAHAMNMVRVCNACLELQSQLD